MVNRRPIIKMEKVTKRSMYQNDERDSDNISYWYEMAIDSINRNMGNKHQSISKFIDECKTKKSANRYYQKCIAIFEKLYENNEYNILESAVEKFVSDVLPYISDINELIEFTGSLNIGQPHIDHITEEAQDYKVCDRILDNDKKLSKRFKLNNYVCEHRYAPINEIVYEVCTMIDTYNTIPDHAKMNIALEELVYSFAKNAIEYNEKEFVESVVDYFLSREENNHSNIAIGYGKVLNESKCISSDNSLSGLKYLYECNINKNNIIDTINDYKLKTTKSAAGVSECLNNILESFSMEDVLINTRSILEFVRNYIVLPQYTKCINKAIFNITEKCISTDLQYINRRAVDIVLNNLNEERKIIQGRIARNTDESMMDSLLEYSESLEDSIERMEDIKITLYTDKERENKYRMLKESSEILYLNEFDKIKMQNLISLANDATKFIEDNKKGIYTAVDAKMTTLFDDIKESNNIMPFVTEDLNIDFCIASIDIAKSKDINKLHEYVSALCEALNNNINNGDYTFYYLMMENSCDIRMSSNYDILLNQKEEKLQEHTMADVDIYRAAQLIYCAEIAEKLDELQFSNIMKDLENSIETITGDQAELFLDFWASSGNIPSEDIGKFVDEFCRYKTSQGEFMEAERLKYTYEHMIPNTCANLDIYLESAQGMRSVLTEGVNINTIQLAAQSLRKKVKDLGAKEKELSRDVDSSVNALVRGIKNFLVSDRREAIIKGSISPSFSKLIKIGILLAGTAAIPTYGPILAGIGLIGGLAMSKNLTKKERALLLDEIDIELQVVEREIKMVEDNNKSSKKYRALLTYQKNLQREKQRIKYNLSMAGKSLPELKRGDK